MLNILRHGAVLSAAVIACSSCASTAPERDEATPPRVPTSVTRTLSSVPSLDAARQVLGQSAEFERTLQGKTVTSDGKCTDDAGSVSSSALLNGAAQGWRMDTYTAEDRQATVDITVVAYPSEDDAASAAVAVTSNLAYRCTDTLSPDFMLGGITRTISPNDVHGYSSTGPGIVYFTDSGDTPCATVVSPASAALIAVMSCAPGPNSNKAFRAATSLLSYTVGNVYSSEG